MEMDDDSILQDRGHSMSTIALDEDDESSLHFELSRSKIPLRVRKAICRIFFGAFSFLVLSTFIFCSIYFLLEGIGVETPSTFDVNDFRLPKEVQPHHYVLKVRTDLDNFKFSGHVDINLGINMGELKPPQSHKILLHAQDLKVSHIALHTQGTESLVFYPESVTYVTEKHMLELIFSEPLETGLYVLSMDFEGEIRDDLSGFYRSSYTDSSGEVHWLASTQFESTDARKAFPCFDEPAFKATFSISLEIYSGFHALSNMPESSSKPTSPGWKLVTFATTPIMSTYLVAYVVSDLACIHTTSEPAAGFGPKEIYVCAQPEQLSTGQYALEVAPKILSFYETHFNIEFPLPKIHLVAIPDFCCGAMENWGLITYRETALLYNEATGSAASKQRVATVISHELAHQWFGNLVTMGWWDDLWLNEGFASYTEFIGVHAVSPDWEMAFLQLYASETRAAMELDALASTHPIEANVTNPETVSQLFDAISYSKGAAVIRMLQSYLDLQGGNDYFITRIHHYLADNAYHNAVTGDLWEALTSREVTDVAKMMSTWTSQPGFPYITVKKTGNNLEITQERFFSIPDQLASDTSNQIWQIPLAYSSSADVAAGTPPSMVLFKIRTLSPLSLTVPPNGWYKLNMGQTVPCRVAYPSSNILQLQKALFSNINSLPAIDRAGLIDDVWSLSNAEVIESSDALIMSKFLVAETNAIVWSIALSHLMNVADLMSDSTLADFKTFVFGLISPSLTHFSKWNTVVPTSHMEKLYLSTILKGALFFEHPETQAKALELFALLKSGNATMNPDILSSIYVAGATSGNEQDYNWLVARYTAVSFATEKQTLLQALASANTPSLIERTLEFAISPAVRTQESTRVISWVSMNREGTVPAWKFLKKNWALIMSRYGEGGFYLSSLIETVVGRLSTQAHLEEAKKFFKDNPVPTASKAVSNALELIEANIAWIEHSLPLISLWLDQNTKK